MKLENQVCSLELAKKLKELGVSQESLWMWVKWEFWEKSRIILSDLEKSFNTACLSGKREDSYAAFTVAELGELLPYDFSTHKCIGHPPAWECSNDELEWHSNPKKGIYREAMHSKTEADTRAKMLIYLIENKLINVNTEKTTTKKLSKSQQRRLAIQRTAKATD